MMKIHYKYTVSEKHNVGRKEVDVKLCNFTQSGKTNTSIFVGRVTCVNCRKILKKGKHRLYNYERNGWDDVEVV